MLTDKERLQRSQSRPHLVQLHRALSRLGSVITVMHTGAHPDDEQSGMLAAMRFGMGMRTVIACSTRGEGGQNSLGPERTGALGVVRTREMEEAARVLDADIAWLGHGPDDPVHDFGFSKNGKDTLTRWGHERTVERLVRAYRQFKPDIVIPTFLDVPGQHGHHRAMTEAAETALALAADPEAFREHRDEGLMPWNAGKFYLPAWPGGGGTYDDEIPPPPTTVTFLAPGIDAATGAHYDEIGEWSRAYHASQGMGHWRADAQTLWPLHLKAGGNGAETDIRDGLPASLGALAEAFAGEAARALVAAQGHIDKAIAAFPDTGTIADALVAAGAEIDTALIGAPKAHAHRLVRKRSEIDAALVLAAGLRVNAWAHQNALAPGAETQLIVRVDAGRHVAPVTLTPVLTQRITAGPATREGTLTRFPLAVAADAEPANAYPPAFASIGGNGLVTVRLETVVGGRKACVHIDLEEAVQIVPRHALTLDPEVLIVRVGEASKTHGVTLRGNAAPGATLEATGGIVAARGSNGFAVTVPDGLAKGPHRLHLTVDGEQAYRQSEIAYPHIGRARYFQPEALDVLALDLTLPEGARIGYVGGGADRVGLWLARMGLDVTELDGDGLAADLSAYTTLVVGIFTFGLRPDLFAAREKLRDWVEKGGHLITLYHRPDDGWDPDATPPRRIVVGSPSLRWRVTDPKAPVDILLPNHKLLAGPNPISAADFSGWDKERGLYFASDWDEAYVPLLSMSDTGEAPLTGSLLSAPIGKGRHTHTSLVLHHQLDRLVPGAFRLMANLVQPG
ncbi:PIG-L family deacetylase [Pelagibacterium lentulum]|uniref:PIG-L domain-containing protein n=1 Tax=Pelagibacterium lentulum TaxID=2029865 RepID=A0A916R7H8_9HYPH|nr:PIG-L family deacetylase [Pelagibacterium lentulum]GGA41700.1 PIG-L domain-containing protein [Pelagibacterium lentulum]